MTIYGPYKTHFKFQITYSSNNQIEFFAYYVHVIHRKLLFNQTNKKCVFFAFESHLKCIICSENHPPLFISFVSFKCTACTDAHWFTQCNSDHCNCNMNWQWKPQLIYIFHFYGNSTVFLQRWEYQCDYLMHVCFKRFWDEWWIS